MLKCDLKLNVFRCHAGYLVCPDFLFLPDHAISHYTHVSSLLVTFVCGWFPDELCARVLNAIHDDRYAYIPFAEAVRSGLPSGLMDAPVKPNGIL